MLTIIGTSDQIKRHKNVNLLRKVVFLNLVFIPGGVQIFEHSNFTKSNKTVLVMIWKWSKRTQPRYLRSVKKTHQRRQMLHAAVRFPLVFLRIHIQSSNHTLSSLLLHAITRHDPRFTRNVQNPPPSRPNRVFKRPSVFPLNAPFTSSLFHQSRWTCENVRTCK